jgi:Mn-containing catalase
VGEDGKELTLFTKQFVQNTADLIKDFVVQIDAEVQARSQPQ